MIEGKSEYEDILQCNNLPSSGTPRGHQFPAAFLIEGSGLDKVNKYLHLHLFPYIPYFIFLIKKSMEMTRVKRYHIVM